MVDIVGTWGLVRTESFSEDGRPLPPPFGAEHPMGRVTFDASGRMMAVLCDGRTQIPDDEHRDYGSYCGNYQFDGTTLTTRVDAASDPARLGSDQVRKVSVEGDLLVLRPPLRIYRGAPEQRVLYWEKLADK